MQRQSEGQVDLLRPRLLIVDDCREDREILKRLFSRASRAEIVEAETGEDAVEYCRAGAFDCVLLDVNLPGADGFETLVELVELQSSLRVVLLTGQRRDDVYAKARESGAHDCLEKNSEMSGALLHTVGTAFQLSMLSQQVKRQRSQFAALMVGALHDLGAPLRHIKWRASRLRDEHSGDLDGAASEFLEHLAGSTTEMGDLMASLNVYAQVMKREPRIGPVDLETIIAGINGPAGPVEVESLPIVLGDRRNMFQLFEQIIGNSLKFRGPDDPRIRVSATSEGDRCCIHVSDNGIGIAPKFHRVIFDPLRRLHTRERYRGDGMGLAICETIVRNHGGSIWVESVLGEGSTIHVDLPCNVVRDDQENRRNAYVQH
ncbi:MAG: signal transduction histidine kinase [Myxococcota bacterium]|jgi:signal transduction histidine kinase